MGGWKIFKSVGRGVLFYDDPPYIAYPLFQILSDLPNPPFLFLSVEWNFLLNEISFFLLVEWVIMPHLIGYIT